MLVGNKVDLMKEDETLRCVTSQVSKKIHPWQGCTNVSWKQD